VFTHVVVDLPPATSRLAVGVLRGATDRWCLAKPDIPSLRTLTSILPSLERLDLPSSSLRIVLNMVGPDLNIRLDEVDEVLPHGLAAALPYARKVGQGTNVGRTIFDLEPNGELACRMDALFRPFVPDDELAPPAAKKRGLIRNPLRRRT
jgi:Flp pilus assembly CpaE family ATPase